MQNGRKEEGLNIPCDGTLDLEKAYFVHKIKKNVQHTVLNMCT